ncbi:MAG: DUF2851 family protein, partial [Muribaculaceae bacterium]|nr:DUF2851 family protein [Muribaculaceae bacterium]
MERLYQYLWKHSMFGRQIILDDGREVSIVLPGILNEDAGPDFSSAKIKVDGTLWVGNVEIHVRATDWYKHNHDKDPAYDGVMLHIVAINDGVVRRSDGSAIPQASVTFPVEFFSLYASLSENIKDVRCVSHLQSLSALVIEDWLSTLAIERMQQKSSRILDIFKSCGMDWERTCFISFARALGFGLNSEPFEMLARSIPLNFLARHSDNLFQLEALLFGQAGMLDMSFHIFDEYYQGLCREYYFLAKKYSLRPMNKSLWKYSKTRPGNFPHRRIAMLAKYLYGGFSLMRSLLETKGDEDKARELFSIDLAGYWIDHIQFGAESGSAPVALSKGSVDLLLINLVAPLIYSHCAYVGDLEGAECSLSLWMTLDPERNTYIRQWQKSGIPCKDAMQSQALLQLRKSYCDMGRCLECRFGHSLLRNRIRKCQSKE